MKSEEWVLIAYNEDAGEYEAWTFPTEQDARDAEPNLPMKYSFPAIQRADDFTKHRAWRKNPKGRNMATKKPSAAQLAARARFAAAAKAGTLKKGKRLSNPLSRVKLKSPSMATKEAPSKRLVKRRKATQKAPEGYYANPLEHTRVSKPAKFEVWTANARGEPVKMLGQFPDKANAVAYGKAYVEAKNVRVAIKGRGL